MGKEGYLGRLVGMVRYVWFEMGAFDGFWGFFAAGSRKEKKLLKALVWRA